MSKVSSCCGAAPRNINNDCDTEDFGLCPDCHEHCDYVEEEGNETPCPHCQGHGKEIIGEHFVSHDMALDAGEPQMEGMHHSFEFRECEHCSGTGVKRP